VPSIAIRHRLTAFVLCSLLTFALLGYLFFAQSDREIAFSAKEDLGTDYIRALMPELVALAKQDAVGQPLPKNDTLDTQMARNDEAMHTGALAEAYRELRDELEDGVHPAAARIAAATLVTRIGDGSNLILDPDLDSHHVMDMLVLKLPTAINAAPVLLTQLTAAKFTPTLSNDDLVQLVANLGAFRAVVSAASDSLAAADAGNADITVKRNLSKPLAAYLAAADAYADAIVAGRNALLDEASRAALDLGKVSAAHQAFQDAALKYWQAVGGEMKRLLGLRIGGFNAKLWTTVGISAVLVVLVLLLSWLLARSIVTGMSGLEGNIIALADGAGNKIIAATGKDEIAAIARAVAHLRDKTVERLGQADYLKDAERARADEARQLADIEKERSERSRQREVEEQRRAVELLGRGLDRLAHGDLTARIDTPFSGALEDLRVALNGTMERFATVIGQLRDTSRSLKIATGDLLAGSYDLSDRSSRLATSND
jgi:methyl-accepting chemotaxis protein